MKTSALRTFVLENHHYDNPISFSYSRLLPYIVSAIGILGIFCVTYAELKDNYFTNAPFLQTALILIKIILHSSYLALVFWLLLFSNPPDNIYKQQLLYPSLLFLAYLVYFLSFTIQYLPIEIPFYKWRIFLKDVSYDMFLLLYSLWAIRDFYEFQEESQRKVEKMVWFFVEGIAIIILCLAIFTNIEMLDLANAKDTAVSFSMMAWLALRSGTTLVKSANYVTIYKNYYSNISAPKLDPSNLKIDNTENVRVILDFGCGGGDRLKQLFKMTTISQDSVKIYGYDKIHDWEDKFCENVNPAKFISDSDELLKILNTVDLVHISHVLYEETSYRDLKMYLKELKPGAIVIFRGNGPNSWLFLYSYIKSKDWFSNNRCHFWNEKWLKGIVKSVGLSRLSKKGATEPDLIISQDYFITTNDSRKDLKIFLNYLYDEVSENFSQKYFTQLVNYQKSSTIPCDDLVYVYRKS